MAEKSFAIPLDENSKQSGDRTFDELTKAGTDVEFELSHATPGDNGQLNLITCKGMKLKNRTFAISIVNNTAKATLTSAQISSVFADAYGGDWDYVRAQWIVGGVDAGGSSNCVVIQGGSTYNNYGWNP